MIWPPPGESAPRAAVVVGYSAWALNKILRTVLGEPAAWRTIVDPLAPRQREALVRALRSIAEAADSWAAVESTAASGSAAAATEPVASAFLHDDEIGSSQAAALLGLGERRVRDLAAAGCLGARRVGGSWRYSRASVLAHAAERRRAG